jgi:hypothetical protein
MRPGKALAPLASNPEVCDVFSESFSLLGVGDASTFSGGRLSDHHPQLVDIELVPTGR